jgi:hypothetical protein
MSGPPDPHTVDAAGEAIRSDREIPTTRYGIVKVQVFRRLTVDGQEASGRRVGFGRLRGSAFAWRFIRCGNARETAMALPLY